MNLKHNHRTGTKGGCSEALWIGVAAISNISENQTMPLEDWKRGSRQLDIDTI